jgi:hypothetical protein
MSRYAKGDFSFITESIIVFISLKEYIFMLKEMYDTIVELEKWDLFDKHPGIFSSDLYEEVSKIHDVLQTGHSSSTFTHSLKHMECIHQNGWDYYVNITLKNLKDVKEKRDNKVDEF